jgi:hypothetical protein
LLIAFNFFKLNVLRCLRIEFLYKETISLEYLGMKAYIHTKTCTQMLVFTAPLFMHPQTGKGTDVP